MGGGGVVVGDALRGDRQGAGVEEVATAGVVDQDVDAAEPVHAGLDRLRNAVVVGAVQSDRAIARETPVTNQVAMGKTSLVASFWSGDLLLTYSTVPAGRVAFKAASWESHTQEEQAGQGPRTSCPLGQLQERRVDQAPRAGFSR